MYCLHCGDCCLRMCPMNGGKCEKVINIGTFYFCGDYENRPKECAAHDFPAQVCPIGRSVLKISSTEEINARIAEGARLIKDKLEGVRK